MPRCENADSGLGETFPGRLVVEQIAVAGHDRVRARVESGRDQMKVVGIAQLDVHVDGRKERREQHEHLFDVAFLDLVLADARSAENGGELFRERPGYDRRYTAPADGFEDLAGRTIGPDQP